MAAAGTAQSVREVPSPGSTEPVKAPRGRRELGVSMVTCQVTDNEVTWARGLSADACPSLQNLGIL